MRYYRSHNKKCRSKCKHKEQQTITTNMLTEFGKIAYVSGPLSQWVRISYFYSKLNKYIILVPKGYKIDLVLFDQILRTQQKKRHSKWMSGAPRNGLQRCTPQQLLYIKMALTWNSFIINIL